MLRSLRDNLVGISVCVAFFGFIIFGAVLSPPGLPFWKQHSPPVPAGFQVVQMGPFPPDCWRHHVCIPTWERVCVNADCRVVIDPEHNKLKVTTCHDPNAENGIVWYTKADRYCE